MHTLITVKYGQVPAGLFDLDIQTNAGRFEWFPAFEEANQHFVNAFQYDSGRRFASFDPEKTLPAPFLDYMPGHFAKKLLQEALRNAGRNVDDLTSLAWISLTGSRGMGAFSFEPSGYPELNAVEPVDLDKMVRYAALVWNDKGKDLSDRRLRDLMRCALSTRGYSPKVLVAINEFTGSVLSGQASIPLHYDAWIIKLDGILPKAESKLKDEYRYSQLAVSAGLRVVQHRLMQDRSLQHLMIRRFDRNTLGAIPYFSCACWEAGRVQWESVFSRIRILRMSFSEMEELYRRMIFIYKTQNKAYNTADICFLFENNTWKLAPAFNLKPGTGLAEFSIGLNGSFDTITDEGLIAFGKSISIRRARKILEHVSEVLQDESNNYL